MPVLADRTARSVISYWHDNVVCLSVRSSVRLWHCVLWLNDPSYSKSLNKWIGNGLIRMRFYNF